MTLYEIHGRRPVVGEATWIAPNASVIGDVRIGIGCYIGFGAVVRGDFGPIIIGDGSIIEDNAVIHAARQARIGRGVIVAHQAMVHDADIGDNVLVGMQALVGSQVIIGADAIVAEQSHLRDGSLVEAGQIVAGRPAKSVGRTGENHRQALALGREAYATLLGGYTPIPRPPAPSRRVPGKGSS